MPEHAIPADVRRFVLTSIPSVPYLEAVLLLRQQPAHTSTARDVARALYISERAATELLHAQCTAGILERENSAYRYAPRNAPLAQALDRLIALVSLLLLIGGLVMESD